jgi:lipoyl-dependent peroxiredoxin
MPATPLTRILYTAEAVTEGGRAGHGRTTDGRLDLQLSVPEDMGGQGGPGTNPEQLFAVGFAACFQSALLGVARGRHLDAGDSQVHSRVGIGPTGHGGFGLQVALDLHAPHLSFDEAADLMAPRGPALPVLQRHPRQHPGHPQRRRDAYPARRGLTRGMQSPEERKPPRKGQQRTSATARVASVGRIAVARTRSAHSSAIRRST